MLISRREIPILIVNLVYVPIFTVIALRSGNHEFLLYVLVILAVGALILWKQTAVQLDTTILWGLTIWGFLHMAGGNIRVGDGVLYGLTLLPIAPSHNILRYDQLVHFFGFGVSTLVAHHLLRPYLRDGIQRQNALAVLVTLMGCGFGALNEIVEFVAVLCLPETGVGGYENTLWDLVFNFLGTTTATIWLWSSGRLGVAQSPKKSAAP